MDPVTMAIVAALSAGVASGSTKLGENLLANAYEAIKTAIKSKVGTDDSRDCYAL
jgi:hypothetical protein